MKHIIYFKSYGNILILGKNKKCEKDTSKTPGSYPVGLYSMFRKYLLERLTLQHTTNFKNYEKILIFGRVMLKQNV